MSSPRGPYSIDVDPVGGGVERPEDHLAGRVVATERVDGDTRHPREFTT